MELRKVYKQTAKKAYNEGKEVYLLPSKVPLGNSYIFPVRICKTDGQEFEKLVNAFEYYNCNKEVGTYASYYIY